MKVKFEDNNKKVEIECPTDLLIANFKIAALLEACDNLDASIPLKEVKVKQQVNPIEFKYTFEANDGRKWSQILRKNAGYIDMNFSVTDYWRLTEFEKHRPVRDAITQLLDIGVIGVDVNWL